MAVTHGNFGPALRPGIDAMFAHKYARYTNPLDSVYKTVTTNKAWAEFLSMAGLPLMSERGLLQETEQSDPNVGYLVQVRPVAYSLGMSIAEETLNDDINGVAKDFTQMLYDSAAETENVLAHVPLNDGFTTTGYDGQALFSAAHPRIGGGTYSNLITAADLSLLLLEDYMIALADAVDDAGKQIRVNPKLLLVPTEESWTAKELLGSEYKPGASNDSMNPAQGFVPWKSSPYLTDADMTVLFTDVPSGGVCIKRKKPFLRHDNDESTLGLYTFMHMRIVYSYLNPRWAWGCAGA